MRRRIDMQKAANNNEQVRPTLISRVMLSAELEILERDGMRSGFRRSIKTIATRICVERARVRYAWEIPCSACFSCRRGAWCRLLAPLEKKKKKEKRTEFSSSSGLWFCLSNTEREVMAHFVKLIGSLERHASELVALNFNSDYTKELTG